MKVQRGTTIKLSAIDEDLIVGENSTIECAGEGSSLKVQGDIKCEGGRIKFTGSVSCSSFRGDDSKVSTRSLTCDYLTIEDGSLEVIGDLYSQSADVDEKLIVSGRTECEIIEVGGTFEAAEVKSRSIRVGGRFRSSSDVEAEDIDVGGTVEILGVIKAKRLEVGGRVNLNRGEVTDTIEVGGTFESKGELKFGEIEVGGLITLGGSSVGGDIEVGGRLDARSDLVFRRLEVGGTANVGGKAMGERIELGGKLHVVSNLELKDALEVGGHVEVGGDTETRSVEIGGSFSSRALRTETAELRGQVKTENGIYASGRVSVEKHSRVSGWIRSKNSITIESKGEADYASAPIVELEDKAKVRGVYAEVLELGDRVEILEEALYTKTLIAGDSSESEFSRGERSGPRKVNSIPAEKMWNFS